MASHEGAALPAGPAGASVLAGGGGARNQDPASPALSGHNCGKQVGTVLRSHGAAPAAGDGAGGLQEPTEALAQEHSTTWRARVPTTDSDTRASAVAAVGPGEAGLEQHWNTGPGLWALLALAGPQPLLKHPAPGC